MQSARTQLLLETLEPRLAAGSYVGIQLTGEYSAFGTAFFPAGNQNSYINPEPIFHRSPRILIKENSDLRIGWTMDQIGLMDTSDLSQDIRESDAGPIFI